MVRFNSILKRVALVGVTLFCVSCETIDFDILRYLDFLSIETPSIEIQGIDEEYIMSVAEEASAVLAATVVKETRFPIPYDFAPVLDIDWESMKPQEEPQAIEEPVVIEPVEEPTNELTGNQIALFAIIFLAFMCLTVWWVGVRKRKSLD